MPNWCINSLRVIGPDQDVQKFKAQAVGHSPWELTGVTVSGTAGLRLGWALIETSGRTRTASLKAAGPGLVYLVCGATGLLLVAASIEAFWSAGPFGLRGKLVFGAIQVVVVATWLGLSGRSR